MAGEGAQAWDALIEAATEPDRATCATLLNGRMYAASKIVNATDALERTALSWACTWGRNACAELLLSKRADPNLADNKGNSPLIRAAMASGDAGRGVAALLLDAKAEIDHPNNNGQTALQFACQYSNVKVARLLLERGADPHLRVSWFAAKDCAERAVRKEELLALLARY